MGPGALCMGRKHLKFIQISKVQVVQLELHPFLTASHAQIFPRNWFHDDHLEEVETLLRPVLAKCDLFDPKTLRQKDTKKLPRDCVIGDTVRLGFTLKLKREQQSILTKSSSTGRTSARIQGVKLVVYVCPRQHANNINVSSAFSQLLRDGRQTDQSEISSYFLRAAQKPPVSTSTPATRTTITTTATATLTNCLTATTVVNYSDVASTSLTDPSTEQPTGNLSDGSGSRWQSVRNCSQLQSENHRVKAVCTTDPTTVTFTTTSTLTSTITTNSFSAAMTTDRDDDRCVAPTESETLRNGDCHLMDDGKKAVLKNMLKRKAEEKHVSKKVQQKHNSTVETTNSTDCSKPQSSSSHHQHSTAIKPTNMDSYTTKCTSRSSPPLILKVDDLVQQDKSPKRDDLKISGSLRLTDKNGHQRHFADLFQRDKYSQRNDLKTTSSLRLTDKNGHQETDSTCGRSKEFNPDRSFPSKDFSLHTTSAARVKSVQGKCKSSQGSDREEKKKSKFDEVTKYESSQSQSIDLPVILAPKVRNKLGLANKNGRSHKQHTDGGIGVNKNIGRNCEQQRKHGLGLNNSSKRSFKQQHRKVGSVTNHSVSSPKQVEIDELPDLAGPFVRQGDISTNRKSHTEMQKNFVLKHQASQFPPKNIAQCNRVKTLNSHDFEKTGNGSDKVRSTPNSAASSPRTPTFQLVDIDFGFPTLEGLQRKKSSSASKRSKTQYGGFVSNTKPADLNISGTSMTSNKGSPLSCSGKSFTSSPSLSASSLSSPDVSRWQKSSSASGTGLASSRKRHSSSSYYSSPVSDHLELPDIAVKSPRSERSASHHRVMGFNGLKSQNSDICDHSKESHRKSPQSIGVSVRQQNGWHSPKHCAASATKDCSSLQKKHLVSQSSRPKPKSVLKATEGSMGCGKKEDITMKRMSSSEALPKQRSLSLSSLPSPTSSPNSVSSDKKRRKILSPSSPSSFSSQVSSPSAVASKDASDHKNAEKRATKTHHSSSKNYLCDNSDSLTQSSSSQVFLSNDSPQSPSARAVSLSVINNASSRLKSSKPKSKRKQTDHFGRWGSLLEEDSQDCLISEKSEDDSVQQVSRRESSPVLTRKRQSQCSPEKGCGTSDSKRQKMSDAERTPLASLSGNTRAQLCLSDEDLQKRVTGLKRELFAVYTGKVHSDRHERYMQGGSERRMLDYDAQLDYVKEGQEDIVMDILLSMFSASAQLKNLDYLMRVMLPEALARVFKQVTGYS